MTAYETKEPKYPWKLGEIVRGSDHIARHTAWGSTRLQLIVDSVVVARVEQKNDGYILNVRVSKSHRGRGYARILIDQLEPGTLHCEPHNKRFWENFGFVVIEKTSPVPRNMIAKGDYVYYMKSISLLS